jgi:DNA primase
MLEDLSYINAKDLLESTDIKNISESSGEISFSCPSADHFHGDTSPSARMNSRTTAFLCHSCGAKGNAITFLAWHKSIPETVARRLLEERYGGGVINAGVGDLESLVKKIMNPEIVEEEKRIPPNESWIETFKVDWRGERTTPIYYMTERGFDPSILNSWQIGYDIISERITIPIRDHEGKLVGFKGRAWRENTIPKYMILGDNRNQTRYGFQPYQKSHYVFGLDRWMQNHEVIEHGSRAILVEGELNVIAMDQHGFSDGLGIAGSEFSEIQCNLIKSFYKKAILFLDNDKAGEKGTKKVIEMLSPYMPLNIVQNAPGDAVELDKKTVKDLINSAQPYLTLQVEGKI